MVRRLLFAAAGLFSVSGVVATATPADAACGRPGLFSRVRTGFHERHVERTVVRHRTGGCTGAVAGCTGFAVPQVMPPQPMPEPAPKK
jgi:hypothetical protein